MRGATVGERRSGTLAVDRGRLVERVEQVAELGQLVGERGMVGDRLLDLPAGQTLPSCRRGGAWISLPRPRNPTGPRSIPS